MNREHVTNFADAWGMDREMAAEIFFSWQNDYTLDNLPALREKWRVNMEECETSDQLEWLKETLGYRMWQQLEAVAAAETQVTKAVAALPLPIRAVLNATVAVKMWWWRLTRR